MPIDRDKFFDAVRSSPFDGSLSQDQVDGCNSLLDYWEENWEGAETISDKRWLAYILATSQWETAQTMQPIVEYGKGSGHEYGNTDPETGQAYYGRGYVQLTWRDNYARATEELSLTDDDDLEWHADRALDPEIAAGVIFEGCREGWFTGKELGDYFNETKDDPVNARQIVNGNDHDDDIAAYHKAFLTALNASWVDNVPGPVAMVDVTVQVVIRVPAGTPVEVLGATVVEGESYAAEKGPVTSDRQQEHSRDEGGRSSAKAGGRGGVKSSA